MAERQEGFLARWSRLKRGPEEPRAGTEPPGTEEETAAVELASLPPLESLGGDSDYTAFLQRGVPDELQRLALRRAWTSDPAIAGFRGFAEYDWDCNAPGYGALRATDNILDLCDSILRRIAEAEPADPAPDRPVPPEPVPARDAPGEPEVVA